MSIERRERKDSTYLVFEKGDGKKYYLGNENDSSSLKLEKIQLAIDYANDRIEKTQAVIKELKRLYRRGVRSHNS